MSLNKHRNFHEMAIEHIVLAHHCANEGKEHEMTSHWQEALSSAGHYMRVLKLQGKHQEAKDYIQGVEHHGERIRTLLGRRMQKVECTHDHSKLAKEVACTGCGYMNKSEAIEKADRPMTSASPARKEMNSKGALDTKMHLTKPKQDPRYNYKKIHELHPEDQQHAQNKYSNDVKQNQGRYLYPVDKQSGRLAHAAVAPYEGTHHPVASTNQLKPEHTKGASVRINSAGHEHHGKLGIMRGAHPDIPGKVGVQVGPHAAHTVYVQPHEVHVSNPKTKVEKALISLNNIRKAFMK